MARIQALKKKLETRIREADPDIFDRFPLERYVGLIEQYPKNVSYEYISPEVKQFCEGILMSSNASVLDLYHKCLLVALIGRAVESDLNRMKLPGEIRGFYSINFERIMNEVENGSDKAGFYLYPNDKFMKDLGVCSLCLIPAGSQKLDLRPLPLSFLFSRGMAEFFVRLKYLIFEVKGTFPLFDQHTDSHDPHLMSLFNADGFRRTYMRFAEILEMNPEIKGVYGRTWFIDPQLEKISPKLCYMRKLNMENGARLFHLGPCSEDGVRDALYKSARRRELFEKGEYFPQNYLVVWPRKPLLGYLERQKRLDEDSLRRFLSAYERDPRPR